MYLTGDSPNFLPEEAERSMLRTDSLEIRCMVKQLQEILVLEYEKADDTRCLRYDHTLPNSVEKSARDVRYASNASVDFSQ